MSDEEKVIQSRIPIEWHVPESIKSVYATNIVVQHTEQEFIISFFMTKPPLIIGTVTKEVLDSLQSIRAECVAQIIVASDRMPRFVKAFQTNLETFQSGKVSITEEE